MENVYLVGSEDVRRAAGELLNAAREMQSAASSMHHTIGYELGAALDRHAAFMDDWLTRFAALLAPSTPATTRKDEQPRCG